MGTTKRRGAVVQERPPPGGGAGVRRSKSEERTDATTLKRVTLFESLNASQLKKIAAISVERTFQAGERIFSEGDAGQEFYVILEGRVRISKQVPGVGEEALTILDPGGYFGEMAVVDDTVRSADAIAHTRCRLAAVKRDDLDSLMFTDKDLAYSLLWTFVRTLAVRLRDTNEKIKTFFVLSSGF